MQFYEKLKELRMSKELTQHYMAEQLQINDRSYQNMNTENGNPISNL